MTDLSIMNASSEARLSDCAERSKPALTAALRQEDSSAGASK